MNDHHLMESNLPEFLKSISTWIAISFAATLTWLGKRQVKRIDDLEKNTAKLVGQDQLNNTIQSLRNDYKEGGDRISRSIDTLGARIDRILEAKAADKL